MNKQDGNFLPEQVDEQIERLAHLGNDSDLPEARLTSDLQRIYDEENEIAAQTWVRLHRHIVQGDQRHAERKDQAPHMSEKEAQTMHKTNLAQQASTPKNRWRGLEILAAVLVIAALIGGMALLFQSRQSSQGSHGNRSSTVQGPQKTGSTTAQSGGVPTAVTLHLSAPGIPSTTQSKIRIRRGTVVTLTVVPNHSLAPYQIYTLGISAGDPFPFSDLKDCDFPNTSNCSYQPAYSDSEATDYTKGTHTFQGFLGDIGGHFLANSNTITITWI